MAIVAMQGVTISTTSSMAVNGVSPSTTRNIDVQGVFLSTLGSLDVQCYTFPSPEVHGCDDADRGQLSGLF